jgi:hypothetical protein
MEGAQVVGRQKARPHQFSQKLGICLPLNLYVWPRSKSPGTIHSHQNGGGRMAQINSIQLHIQTGNLSGAGTDGDIISDSAVGSSLSTRRKTTTNARLPVSTLLAKVRTSGMPRKMIPGTRSCSRSGWRTFRSIYASSLGPGMITGSFSVPTCASTNRFISTGTR